MINQHASESKSTAQSMAQSIAQARLQAQLETRFQIEVFDSQLHQYKPLDNNSIYTPFIKGVLVHLLILAVIIFGNLTTKIEDSQPFVETSLVTPEQLATIQSQIIANRSQAMKADIHDPNAPAVNRKSQQQPVISHNKKSTLNHQQVNQPTKQQVKANQATHQTSQITQANNPTAKPNPNTNKPDTNKKTTQPLTATDDAPTPTIKEPVKKSQEAIERDKKIALRQSQFEKALQAFTQEEENKIKQKKQQRLKAKQQKRQQEHELVEVFKKAESKTDEIIEKNKQAYERTREKQQQMRKKAELKNQARLAINSTSNIGSEPTVGYSGNTNQSMGANRTQTNNLSIIGARIRRYLYPPTNSGRDTATVRITVNANGDVIRVFATGRNEDLNRATEQAVKAASPLPISPNDTYYPTFSITFKGEGNK